MKLRDSAVNAREQSDGAGAERVPPPHGQVLEDARLGVPEARVPRRRAPSRAHSIQAKSWPCGKPPAEMFLFLCGNVPRRHPFLCAANRDRSGRGP